MSSITVLNPSSIRGHIAELDGLRAVGLSLVLLDHFALESFPAFLFQLGSLGWIAMDSFFVMSGFLITGILLDSREKPKFFSTYYIRRALRIFPLYYAVLLFWYVILTHANSGIDYRNMIHYWGSPAWLTFYLGNIRQAMVVLPQQILHSAVGYAYAPLWSLQIEEQFYLLFPLAVAFLRRDHLRNLLIGALCFAPICRLLFYWLQPDNPYLQYVELPTHCEGIALGALIAIRFRSGPWIISKPKLTALTGALMGLACAGSIVSTWGTRNQGWASLWDRLVGYSVSSYGCACLVLWLIVNRDSKYTLPLRVQPLRYLGKICYGVYLLHPIAMWTVLELSKKRVITLHRNDVRYVFLGIGLSLIYATVSWYCFEGLFLKLKDRIPYGRPVRPPVPVFGVATTD